MYNNPVGYIDPNGHDPFDEQEWETWCSDHDINAPQWYDYMIYLFHLAYPDEWNWDDYRSKGESAIIQEIGEVFTHPGAGRSWDSLGDALERLGTHYGQGEEYEFVRDIGFLYGRLRNRFEAPESTFAYTNPDLGRPWAYLNAGGMPHELTGGDPDANVHHWAWSLVVGRDWGPLGGVITRLYEANQMTDDRYSVAASKNWVVAFVAGFSDTYGDPGVHFADVTMGERGAAMGFYFQRHGVFNVRQALSVYVYPGPP